LRITAVVLAVVVFVSVVNFNSTRVENRVCTIVVVVVLQQCFSSNTKRTKKVVCSALLKFQLPCTPILLITTLCKLWRKKEMELE
jgi:hypothetical protein